jgi:hypothetical protein
MKKKTISYPPVEYVTLPQFARRARPALVEELAARRAHSEEVRTQVLEQFPASVRKLAR